MKPGKKTEELEGTYKFSQAVEPVHYGAGNKTLVPLDVPREEGPLDSSPNGLYHTAGPPDQQVFATDVREGNALWNQPLQCRLGFHLNSLGGGLIPGSLLSPTELCHPSGLVLSPLPLPGVLGGKLSLPSLKISQDLLRCHIC